MPFKARGPVIMPHSVAAAAAAAVVLGERIVAAWNELDQRIIDTAVSQWCTRLRACVKALGGHFEHKL